MQNLFIILEKLKIDFKIKTFKKNAVKTAIDETIDLFGQYSAGALVNWTHEEGSPWYESTHGGKDLYGPIPDNLIKSYFSNLINK